METKSAKNTENDDCMIGNARFWIQPEDFIAPKKLEKIEFTVLEAEIQKTEWGKKGILGLQRTDDTMEYQISSWNLCAKKPIVFNESLVGQKVYLTGFSDKKVLLTFQ